jgi:chromosome segregation ATPase
MNVSTKALVFVALWAHLSAAAQPHAALLQDAALLQESDAAGPLTKVIALLKDIQKELAAEAKEDKKAHDEIACWCKTNLEGKTKQVEDAKKKDDELVANIQQHAASSSSLDVDLADLKKDIAENEKALAEAVALRKKEAADFHQGETDLIQAINSLKGAIVVLSKHHDAMLQTDLNKDPAVRSMKPDLRRLIHRHLDALQFLLPEAKKTLEGFLNAQDYVFQPDVSLMQTSSLRNKRLPFKSYAPQSGAILGILKQMLEAFKGDMSENSKDELSKIDTYTTMKAAKEEEISQQKGQVETKTQEFATAKEDLAGAKNDLEDTRAAMSADQKFLLEITEKCTKAEFEWEERLKTRTEEQQAISEAIAILDTDDVRDAQKTTFGFLQVAQVQKKVVRVDTVEKQRAHALSLVKATFGDSPRVGPLLVALQLDAFTKVKAFIDQLVEDLKKEQADEVKERDTCIDNLAQNERDTDKKTFEVKQLETLIEKLTAESNAIAEELKTLKAEIADLQVELQRAGDMRKEENAEFQKTAADQHLVQDVLAKAITKLRAFYSKRHSLIQEKKAAPGEAPAKMPKMKAYKKNSKSTGVLGLMERFIGDAKVLEAQAIADEQNAQEAYQELVAGTNDSVRAKSRAVVDKTEEKAKVDQENEQAKADHEQGMKDLEALAEELGALHKECDFLLKNFEARQTARAAEMDALREVKAILSGMK